MSDQKERALAAFEQRKNQTRDQIVEFAIEVEFGEYPELIASHMLMMVSSDRQQASGERGYPIEEKCDRMIRKVTNNYQGDGFSGDAAEAAKAALLQAPQYDAEALYGFVSCFPAKALQIFGI